MINVFQNFITFIGAGAHATLDMEQHISGVRSVIIERITCLDILRRMLS